MSKRILSIKIKREMDDSPDSSYLGTFADTAKTDFAIDRRHDLECASVSPENAAKVDELEREIRSIDAERIKAAEINNDDLEEQLSAKIDALIEQQEKLQECDCGGTGISRQHFHFFNPGSVEPFNPNASWIPGDVADKKAYWLKTMRENARKDFERMESLQNGGWHFMGIYAVAEIELDGTVQEVRTPGLWGIESDSDRDYITEVSQEELSELRKLLHSLGFSKRAIARAVASHTDKTK